jgi:hypothetical protein
LNQSTHVALGREQLALAVARGLRQVDRYRDAILEVLRLVVLDGVMEMRFCGARVQLGPLMT